MPSKSKSKKSSRKKSQNPLEPVFRKTPRSFRIGGSVLPKRDLGRFVRWPRYIRIQRQRKVLKQRLKTPPAINQFSVTLDKNQATEAMKLFNKYRRSLPRIRRSASAPSAPRKPPLQCRRLELWPWCTLASTTSRP